MVTVFNGNVVPGETVGEYRIEELARAAGTTVRNVRAYRDRGLVPPPRRDGRVAIYDDDHLERLRLVAALLERGYTLANIGELLGAWEQGRGLAEVLGDAAGADEDGLPVEDIRAVGRRMAGEVDRIAEALAPVIDRVAGAGGARRRAAAVRLAQQVVAAEVADALDRHRPAGPRRGQRRGR